MADPLTDLQEALRQLPLDQAMDTLALIDKLTRNIVRSPSEAKFRKINLTNDKIRAAIGDVPNAIALMREMGWVQEDDSLVLPASVRLDHAVHVIGIIEAQDFYKTKADKEKVRKTREAKEVDTDTEKLRKQIEADRKEKAAEGPVTRGSVAKDLPNGGHMTAGDLGIQGGGG